MDRHPSPYILPSQDGSDDALGPTLRFCSVRFVCAAEIGVQIGFLEYFIADEFVGE